MPRVKKGVTAHRRHKKILKLAKGYRGAKSKQFKKANETVMKGLYYARRDRRAKKGEFRRLWIARINAAARINGISYSRLINGLTKADVQVNRKMLADLAINDAAAFAQLVAVAKEQLRRTSVNNPPRTSSLIAPSATPSSNRAV
jgi:large subunit ribosomal protein L20